jgi:pilus assembly protein CpaF
VPGNDVVLPKGNVSKRHSRIVLKDNRFIVVDLKSTNGTYVNGRKITSPLVVKEGDKIYIGDFILTLEGDAALTAPSDAMKPPSVLPGGSPETPGPSSGVPGSYGATPQVGSVPPPLPSRAPEPMADELPAVLRSAESPPSSPPSGQSSTSVGLTAPSIPPVIGESEVAEHAVPEKTNVVAFPSEEHTASEQVAPQAVAVGAIMRSAPPMIAPSHPSGGSTPLSKTSVPPQMRDDLRSLMTRLGREFDIDNADPAAVSDEKRWQKAERAIQGKLGELTSDGTIGRGADKASLARAALHEAVGLGPLDALLGESDVRHVVIERFDRVRADRGKGLSLESGAAFSSPQALLTVARRLLAQGGVEGKDPTSVDLALPTGLQLVLVMPNAASEGPVLSLRRRPPTSTQLSVLEQEGLVSAEHQSKLRDALAGGKNVWVVGASNADTAGLVSSLLDSCPAEQRVALFERAPDVALGSRAAVCFKLGVVALAELLERVRYFRPDRLVLHELRDADLAAAVAELAKRRDGSLASSEHGSAEQLVAALEQHAPGQLAARGVDIIVEVGRDDAGKTRVVQLRHLESTASGKLALKGA